MFNQATIIGYLGKDPELRDNGRCTFSIATTEKWTDKSTGEKRDKTTWHNCVAWGQTGELIKQYISKGDPLMVQGPIDNRSYEKDGETKYISEIRVNQFTFMPRGGDTGAKAPTAPPPSSDDEEMPF